MKFNFKHLVFICFVLLLILILSVNTVWRVCTVCGMQDFDRSLFGKKIELISKHEFDEFGTHAEWRAVNGKAHEPHNWMIIEEKITDLSKEENN